MTSLYSFAKILPGGTIEMFRDRAYALRQQAAAEVFAQLRKDQQRVPVPLSNLLAHLETYLFDPDLSVNHWMRACGIRDKALSARFTHEMGHTPWGYVTHLRLQVAATLLLTSDLNLWRIGTAVGFSDGNSFGRAFKRWAGCSPSVYRKRGGLTESAQMVPKPLIEPEQIEQALEGRLAPELAEKLHQTLKKFVGQLEITYPHLRAREEKAKSSALRPVVGAELLERTMAEQLWVQLRNHSAEEQLELVKSQVAFSTPALFELLLLKSREEGRKDRRRGAEVARLALESLEAIDEVGNRLANYRVRGWAWIGHAHRMALEWHEAEQACAAGKGEWDAIQHNYRDERVAAELWLSKAALRTSQRHFDEAFALTDLAIATLRDQPGIQAELLRALMLKGIILGYQGNHFDALAVLEEVRALKPQDPHLQLVLYAEISIANIRAGQLNEASKSLKTARSLCLQVDNYFFLLQIDWIEGLFEQQSGRLKSAQKKLAKAREGFSSAGELAYYAVVSLDLAILHATEGDLHQAVGIAADVVEVLESLKYHRELFVVLQLLQHGLVTQQISLVLLEEARSLLEKAKPLGFENLTEGAREPR